MDRPRFDADPLQCKDRRGIADVPIGDVRLDRQQIHVGSL
jgi:hypothetical protein